MASKIPALSRMKTEMSEPVLKGKKKQVDTSKPPSKFSKQRLVHAKASAPYLKSKNATESVPETPKQQLRNPSSAPGFKGQRSEPNLRRVASTRSAKYSKSSHSPLNAPRVPGLPRSKSSWTLGGSEKKGVPRFMSSEHARSIRSVRYNPPPKTGEFKLPTITGCTPTRSRFPELEPKHETRSERMIKAIRDPKGMMVTKYKGAMKQLSGMEMLKKMHKCLNTIKPGGSRHVEARWIPLIEKPLYQLRAIKRASTLLTMPRSQPTLTIAQVERMLEANRQRLSVGTTMSRRSSVYSDSVENIAEGPGVEQGPADQQGSAIVNEEEADEDRTVRESLLLFREWLDFLQVTANPFAEDEDFTSPAIPLTSPQHSSSSLPLTHDTLQSLQNLSFPDEDRSNSASPTSSDITITPANAHTFLKMSSSSKPASHDPFVDSTEVNCTKAGNGNIESSHPTVMKQGTAKAGESSATRKSEPRNLKALSYRPGNESDTNTPHAPHQAKDTKVRPSSRIPRGPANMQTQMPPSSEQKEARATSGSRSSIPLISRIHGAEQMRSASNVPVGSFSGSIRVVERPRGPRPQIAGEWADPKIEMPEPMSSSYGEEGDLQKPPTVFTGEYRTRKFPKSASCLDAPKLKIASSAEQVLMGEDTKGGDEADTQRSHPALEHSDPLECLQKEINDDDDDDDDTPRPLPATLAFHNQSAEQTPATRNFCRPHHFGGSLRSNPVTPTQKPLGAFSDDIGNGYPSTSRIAYRSSSMQAVADFPLHPKVASAIDLSQKQDIGQDNLAVKASGPAQAGGRRFGNIRNIFKSTKGNEKARGRREENEAPGAASKEAVPETIKARAKRNVKISPAQISPPMPMTEEESRSFARATTLTRTRAEPPRDGRIRRANLAAMSTGSPQGRGAYRRSQAMMVRDGADAAIEGLIAKARGAAAPGKREEYLRLALRLQKQLDEYKEAERAAVEASAWAANKRSAKADAEAVLLAAASEAMGQ
ncbi:uncharacterized protein KD926_006083 [Aspergillus affinis]|uniref:uncharacterized protein n=1 Tax=Aspergillus affinis TaxID=1070780 RepID=UPI0022FE9545|nr:uncharacterized protein KD926_006083 [Aspergillus affinis]KAI9042164.1 hypothetical protein KD926_006083 [Aspergillus affinis]